MIPACYGCISVWEENDEKEDGSRRAVSGPLLAVLPATHALADPPDAEEVKDEPGKEPTVTRGMPDLVRYWNFDPPKSPLFDIGRMTISGDIRVRPEFRANPNFGLASTAGHGRTTGAGPRRYADQFVQQWTRLGLNYAMSRDVDAFFQMQYAKIWGAKSNPAEHCERPKRAPRRGSPGLYADP